MAGYLAGGAAGHAGGVQAGAGDRQLVAFRMSARCSSRRTHETRSLPGTCLDRHSVLILHHPPPRPCCQVLLLLLLRCGRHAWHPGRARGLGRRRPHRHPCCWHGRRGRQTARLGQRRRRWGRHWQRLDAGRPSSRHVHVACSINLHARPCCTRCRRRIGPAAAAAAGGSSPNQRPGGVCILGAVCCRACSWQRCRRVCHRQRRRIVVIGGWAWGAGGAAVQQAAVSAQHNLQQVEDKC